MMTPLTQCHNLLATSVAPAKPCLSASHVRKALAASAFILCMGTAWAQQPADSLPADWKEGPVPPAPALNAKRLVAIDMPSYSALKVGLDLDSLTVAQPDGVVRYVTMLQGRDGTKSAYYQGIRCNTYEVRTYARYQFDAQPPGWETVNTEWRNLHDARSRYANAIAKAGACENSVAPPNTETARRIFGRNPNWQGSQ